MIERFERFSYAISEISRYWHKLASEEMDKYGLKGTHSVYLLTMARHHEGMTASQIGELCGRDKSDVSRMMAIMEKNGLVTKEGVHQNLYRGVFKLTKQGYAAADSVRRRATLAVDIAGRDLTEENRAIFYRALETIAVNLRILSKEGLPEEQPPSDKKGDGSAWV